MVNKLLLLLLNYYYYYIYNIYFIDHPLVNMVVNIPKSGQ